MWFMRGCRLVGELDRFPQELEETDAEFYGLTVEASRKKRSAREFGPDEQLIETSYDPLGPDEPDHMVKMVNI